MDLEKLAKGKITEEIMTLELNSLNEFIVGLNKLINDKSNTYNPQKMSKFGKGILDFSSPVPYVHGKTDNSA